MEKSLKKDIIINRLPVVIYFILIFAALMVIISAVAPMSNHEPKTTDTYSDFSTGWLNCEESEASLDHLSGTTVIHRTITADDCNKTLFFFAKTSNIKVFIDGVCQYRNNQFCSQFFGKTPGALFVNVLIPAESDGKLLEIEIENPYKDDDSAKLDEMYIGDISDIIQFQQQKRFNSFCISFIIMVLGVVMLLLFIPLTRQKIVGIEFLNLGVTAFVPADILDEAVLYLRVYFVGFPFLFMYNILSTMFTSIGESRIPLGLLIFSSVLNIFMDLWMVAGLDLGVFGAALATLIAQGISAVFSLLIFFSRMRRYKSRFEWFDRHELHSMLRIAVPSVLQQSTVSIGMMIVQAVVNPFGTQALAGYSATMRVENVFSLIFVSIGNAVSPFVSQNLGAKKTERIKKGYHAALVLDLCFAVLAFIVIETLHTQISSLFLGKDGTALAYQVSGDYMRWLGFFFIFMGIKMATDGVLRGLGIMRPFLAANMVNLAIRLSVALICAPRFGIAFVWLAVPAGWLANFLISYVALRKSWPAE